MMSASTNNTTAALTHLTLDWSGPEVFVDSAILTPSLALTAARALANRVDDGDADPNTATTVVRAIMAQVDGETRGLLVEYWAGRVSIPWGPGVDTDLADHAREQYAAGIVAALGDWNDERLTEVLDTMAQDYKAWTGVEDAPFAELWGASAEQDFSNLTAEVTRTYVAYGTSESSGEYVEWDAENGEYDIKSADGRVRSSEPREVASLLIDDLLISPVDLVEGGWLDELWVGLVGEEVE